MRRIVTGHDENGTAEVVSTGAVPRKEFLPGSKNEINFFWCTAQTPLLPHAGGDPTTAVASFMPPPGGTTFLIMRFAPNFQSPVHATDTVDYCTVISGKIWLVLEDGTEELLQAGDCVVQNGTRHAWHNRAEEPCVMSSVMIGARRG